MVSCINPRVNIILKVLSTVPFSRFWIVKEFSVWENIFHLALVSRPIGRWGEALALTFCHFSRGFGTKTKQLHRPFDIVSNPFLDHLLFFSLKSYKMLKALLGKPATTKWNFCRLCKLSNKTHLSHIWEECSGIRFNAWFKNDEVGH